MVTELEPNDDDRIRNLAVRWVSMFIVCFVLALIGGTVGYLMFGPTGTFIAPFYMALMTIHDLMCEEVRTHDYR